MTAAARETCGPGTDASSAPDGVRARLRRIPTTLRRCAVGGGALCLVAGAFIGYEQHQYAGGRAYGERNTLIGTHVFDGERPRGDTSSYADRAEQECVEHGAEDGEAAEAPKWVEGCTDAVLGR
ncbi:hypothetical protein DSC45_17770 [Streptomyces sp. YIM 130001]|uniref:hypothetical protein n=1 Tax=Streptomyces sp. YIM 130001 TaxID=2259644 RepID=UPI000EC403DF|nr:hypothetical protein [Streptomyces sp. YIM 130001]RII15681.1 hypothetical protein DSC45_17770 [Streptomyces sp. YIM 130001]